MSKIDTALSEVFGVPTIRETEGPPAVVEQPKPAENDIEDFSFVRNKLHALLSEGTMAFETLASIAKSEEKVSAFQALNEMLANLSDISIKLLDIQEKKQKLAAKTEQAAGGVTNVTNNIAYVGSTADLDALLNSHNFLGDDIDQDEDDDTE